MTETMLKTSKKRAPLVAPDLDSMLPQKLWSEILPNLYQGGTHDDDIIGDSTFAKPFTRGVSPTESFITEKDFDTVVTMYQYANPAGWFVNEMRYGFYDAGMHYVNIDRLRKVVEYAYDSWKAGDKVLVRCQAGLNRSGLVMALVLIKEGYEPLEAISLIRDKRSPDALFNKDYVAWLLDLDVAEWRN